MSDTAELIHFATLLEASARQMREAACTADQIARELKPAGGIVTAAGTNGTGRMAVHDPGADKRAALQHFQTMAVTSAASVTGLGPIVAKLAKDWLAARGVQVKEIQQ